MTASLTPEPLGILAHELRNPLASATTNVAVVADLCEEEDPRKPFLKRAEHDLDRIRRLLSSCLQLACAGRVRAEPCSIEELIERAAVACRGCADGGVRVEIDVPESLQASVDAMLVERAVANLCENAARAAGPTGLVRIRSHAEHGKLTIVVDDSGPGVDPEMADRIFEPFVSGARGSGLGLAFVRRVARAHGGNVALERSPLGGARFTLCLEASE